MSDNTKPKIINAKIYKFPDYTMERGKISGKASYSIAENIYLPFDNENYKEPIGIETWIEQTGFKFYSKTDTGSGYTRGLTCDYLQINKGYGPATDNYTIKLEYIQRTNTWTWETNEVTDIYSEYYFYDDYGNWTVNTPKDEESKFGESYKTYGLDQVVYEHEEVPRVDENGEPVKDANGKPIIDIISTPVEDIYIVTTHDPIVIYGEWSDPLIVEKAVGSFYRAPKKFDYDVSGEIKIGLNCPPTLKQAIPDLVPFINTASAWKSWLTQTECSCPEWGSGKLTAAVLNSIHKFCGTGKSYLPNNKEHKVSLGMFTSLFDQINTDTPPN